MLKSNEGKPSYAFVRYQHEESVPYAIALLNGIKLFDKALQVKARSGTQQAKRIEESYRKQRDQNFQEERSDSGRRKFEDSPSLMPVPQPYFPPIAITDAPHFMQYAGVGGFFASPAFMPPPLPPSMSPMAMGGRHADLRDTSGGYYQHYDQYRRDESGDRSSRRNNYDNDARGRGDDRHRPGNERDRGYHRRSNSNARYEDKYYDYDETSNRSRYERR